MPTAKNARIIIVDDDPDDRELIVAALLQQGFEGDLSEFENGKLLTEYLESHPEDNPDLILLDLNMPVKNGFETLRDLKANKDRKNIPVVIFSASTKKEDEHYCVAAGSDRYLHKPFDLNGYNDVAQLIHSLFSGATGTS